MWTAESEIGQCSYKHVVTRSDDRKDLDKTMDIDNWKARFEENKELDSKHWLSKRSYKKSEEYGPNYSKTAQSPSAPPHCVNCLVSQAGTLIILQNKCFEFPHVSLCVIASKNIRWMMDDILGNNSVTNRCFSYFVHHCVTTLRYRRLSNLQTGWYSLIGKVTCFLFNQRNLFEYAR